MDQPTAPKKVLIDIPDGPAGVRVVLSLMRRLVKESRTSPEIRALAEQITASVPEKAFRREAELIHNWVRDNIRYQLDPDQMEMIRGPLITLESRSGDCDDKCILTASLLVAIGHPCRFVAIACEPDNFSHVFLQTLVGREWLGSDTTEREPFGWEPREGVVSRMVQDI